MCDLSVAVVAYKNYTDVIQMINSLENYTSKSLSKKVYVIDNSEIGDDEEKKIRFIEKLSSFTDVEYIDCKKNLGFGGGNNYILDMIHSKYHAIVNPDIIFIEDAFTKIIDFMKKNDIQMCIPRIEDPNGKLQAVYRRELNPIDMIIRMFLKNLFKRRQAYHTMQDMDFTKPFQVPFGQGSFLVISSNLFKNIGGFDERYFMYVEDADLCKRVNKKAELIYFPDAKVIHKWEKGSHKNKKLLMYHIVSACKYFIKWNLVEVLKKKNDREYSDCK